MSPWLSNYKWTWNISIHLYHHHAQWLISTGWTQAHKGCVVCSDTDRSTVCVCPSLLIWQAPMTLVSMAYFPLVCFLISAKTVLLCPSFLLVISLPRLYTVLTFHPSPFSVSSHSLPSSLCLSLSLSHPYILPVTALWPSTVVAPVHSAWSWFWLMHVCMF